MTALHLVPVATGISDFEAKLVAARLGADGILWQTRGIVDSIYPFGGIDVLVPVGQLDDARAVLADILDRPAADDRGPASRNRSRWLALATVGAAASVVALRVLTAI